MPEPRSRIPLTRAEIEAAVRLANIPALLMTVYQFSGDPVWLSEEYRPTRAKGLDDNDSGGLPPETQARIRAAAVETFLRLQDGEAPAIQALDPAQMVEAMAVFTHERIGPEYGRMLSTEYARRTGLLEEEPARAEPGSGFRVAIIGAGVGGIAAAQECRRLGIEVVLLEADERPGGVWWKNDYPGAGVDTASHLYSLSFARHDWSRHYALRDEIQGYLAETLDGLAAAGLDARFGTAVERMDWDAERSVWRLSTRSADRLETLEANAVICAAGGLNRPSIPELPGQDAFHGLAFHSSQWPAELELEGRRVVVIGTGASAMQIVPEIAPRVGHLTVVQRTPQWVAPFDKFRARIPDELRALLGAFPSYYGWYWLRQFWQFGDNVLESLRIDPDWPHPERSVNARNDGHRQFFTGYIRERLGERSDLLPAVVPDYPPFGKRILLDNGWYDALRRPEVELVTGTATAIEPDAVITTAGRHPADVIVWATGFQATRFLGSVEVHGIDGREIHEVWDENDSRSYLGVAVPGFPNLFTLGGPNSFPGSGSIMFWLELQARYVCRLIDSMLAERIAAIEVRPELHAAYNDLIDAEHARMVWTHPGMTTYYRGASGRVVFVSPFRNVDFWERLRAAGLDDYVATRAAEPVTDRPA